MISTLVAGWKPQNGKPLSVKKSKICEDACNKSAGCTYYSCRSCEDRGEGKATSREEMWAK